MAIKVDAFLALALKEIRAARAGDVIQPSDQDDALAVFNELLEALSGTSRALFAVTFPTFNLIANHQPHTIGPGGDFNVTRRPVSILSGSLWISTTIKMPLWFHDRTWWSQIMAPKIAVTVPGDAYYEPEWPLGKFYFWPIESSALQVELQLRTELLNVVATDTLDLPQGYQQALRLTLAELLAPMFGQTVSASTAQKAREARAQVWGNNDRIPNLRTRDGGMPGGHGGGHGGYDHFTGTVGGRW